MRQIIVFPRGQLTEVDRARMDDVGITAIEADDPSAVVTVIPGVPLASSDDLMLAALTAVAASPLDSVAARFVKELHARLASKERA